RRGRRRKIFLRISQGHLGAELLGDNAAHHRTEIFAGFFVDEGFARIVPAELETCGKRGDPDFADGRVGRNDELGLLGFFKENFKFSGFAFDVKAVFIAGGEHAPLEVLEGSVGSSLKVFFVEHAFSVHEESKPWVVRTWEARRKETSKYR